MRECLCLLPAPTIQIIKEEVQQSNKKKWSKAVWLTSLPPPVPLQAQPVLLHSADIQSCCLSRQDDINVEGGVGGLAGTGGQQRDLTLVM